MLYYNRGGLAEKNWFSYENFLLKCSCSFYAMELLNCNGFLHEKIQFPEKMYHPCTVTSTFFILSNLTTVVFYDENKYGHIYCFMPL